MSVCQEGSVQDFVEEATNVVNAARKKGLELRIMGAIAVWIHCPRFSHLHEASERKITDIDVVGYGKQKDDALRLLSDLGYVSDRRARMLMTVLQRYQLQNPTNNRKIDVFFDKLEMCHTIDFRGRLQIDYPTISLADLFLEKTQIVEINEKDIKDVIVLLREHEIGMEGRDVIDSGYISTLLSGDWGFYYTVTRNLSKVKGLLAEYRFLTDEDRSDIAAKIDSLSEAIEKREKSIRWKIRARMGPGRPWYNKVEECGL